MTHMLFPYSFESRHFENRHLENIPLCAAGEADTHFALKSAPCYPLQSRVYLPHFPAVPRPPAITPFYSKTPANFPVPRRLPVPPGLVPRPSPRGPVPGADQPLPELLPGRHREPVELVHARERCPAGTRCPGPGTCRRRRRRRFPGPGSGSAGSLRGRSALPEPLPVPSRPQAPAEEGAGARHGPAPPGARTGGCGAEEEPLGWGCGALFRPCRWGSGAPPARELRGCAEGGGGSAQGPCRDRGPDRCHLPSPGDFSGCGERERYRRLVPLLLPAPLHSW